ncbi:MAG: leucyl/phenylalanyl-tRNA--protein transferase [Proteobacteria bacterium]|nr:leucyl/phenylalanyl-tRNA--protein transferase [Pseudomonadota bacterium]
MIPVLTEDPTDFPDPATALKDPNGLLAMGGDLKPERLITAYRQGIFPWYDHKTILWWSPDPRTILKLKDLHVSKSLKKNLRQQAFHLSMDEKFTEVIQQCAALREIDLGTWINAEMQKAYIQVHKLGYAHSIEVLEGNTLVGGIYGVSLGRLFFGESMFSLRPNASKIALVYLVRQLEAWDFEFIDCQVWSEHLASLGATTIARKDFLQLLSENNKFESKIGKWKLDV